MANESNEAVSRRFYGEVWNEGRVEIIDELVDPAVTVHDVALPDEVRGAEGLKQLVRLYRSAFPDVSWTVLDMISDGDKVVIHWAAEATHRGELMGLAPTGRQMRVTGISIERYGEGRLVEVWINWDNLGLLQQLGAAPAPGSVGERIGKAVQRVLAARERRRTASKP